MAVLRYRSQLAVLLLTPLLPQRASVLRVLFYSLTAGPVITHAARNYSNFTRPTGHQPWPHPLSTVLLKGNCGGLEHVVDAKL